MRFVFLLVCQIVVFHLSKGSQLFEDYKLKYGEFTVKVYQKVSESNSGSFVVSPLSANIILALVTSGGNGDTAKELSSALGVPENSKEIQRIFTELTPNLQNCHKYNLSSANKAYIKTSYSLSDEFKEIAVKAFDAGIESIDFTDINAATAKINKWVEDKTQNKIKHLIDPSTIDPRTCSILVNTIYFQGNWTQRFGEPRKEDFFIDSVKKVKIDMLVSENRLVNFFECPRLNAKFIELPYMGDEVSMFVALPNKIDGLSELEKELPKVLFSHRLKQTEVDVKLPKFKLETNIDFKDILSKLGVKLAFTNAADFTSILSNKARLVVSEIKQKAVIEVDKDGTTAAAATYVGTFWLSNHVRFLPNQTFYADHPFLYYLHLKKLNITLFIGRYKGPTQ